MKHFADYFIHEGFLDTKNSSVYLNFDITTLSPIQGVISEVLSIHRKLQRGKYLLLQKKITNFSGNAWLILIMRSIKCYVA